MNTGEPLPVKPEHVTVRVVEEESCVTGHFILRAKCPCGWSKWQQKLDAGVLRADIEGHLLACPRSKTA